MITVTLLGLKVWGNFFSCQKEKLGPLLFFFWLGFTYVLSLSHSLWEVGWNLLKFKNSFLNWYQQYKVSHKRNILGSVISYGKSLKWKYLVRFGIEVHEHFLLPFILFLVCEYSAQGLQWFRLFMSYIPFTGEFLCRYSIHMIQKMHGKIRYGKTSVNSFAQYAQFPHPSL